MLIATRCRDRDMGLCGFPVLWSRTLATDHGGRAGRGREKVRRVASHLLPEKGVQQAGWKPHSACFMALPHPAHRGRASRVSRDRRGRGAKVLTGCYRHPGMRALRDLCCSLACGHIRLGLPSLLHTRQTSRGRGVRRTDSGAAGTGMAWTRRSSSLRSGCAVLDPGPWRV